MELADARQEEDQPVEWRAKDEAEGGEAEKGEDPRGRAMSGLAGAMSVRRGAWRLGRKAMEQGQRCEQQGQYPHVCPPLDVVLDPPVGGGDRLAIEVVGGGGPSPAEEVEHLVLRGIAEEIGHEEGDDAADGVGPAHDLLIGHLSLSKAACHQLEEWDVLYRAQPHSQPHQGQAPQAGTARSPGPGPAATPLPPPPGPDDAQQGVVGHHQQHVVSDLDVPGQQVHPQPQGTAGHLQQRCPPVAPLPALHDSLQHRQ
jgi:hypothetical protein